MGWSDISISLSGPIVGSLIDHFVDRWNYVYSQKYRGENKYSPLQSATSHPRPAGDMFHEGERVLGDIRQRFHHDMHHMMRIEDDSGERQGYQEGGGEIQIQLTRRYAKLCLPSRFGSSCPKLNIFPVPPNGPPATPQNTRSQTPTSTPSPTPGTSSTSKTNSSSRPALTPSAP